MMSKSLTDVAALFSTARRLSPSMEQYADTVEIVDALYHLPAELRLPIFLSSSCYSPLTTWFKAIATVNMGYVLRSLRWEYPPKKKDPLSRALGVARVFLLRGKARTLTSPQMTGFPESGRSGW